MKLKIERKYLPSRKFIISLSIALLFVISAVALNFSGGNKAVYKNNITVENSTSTFEDLASLTGDATETADLIAQKSEFDGLNDTQKLARQLISNIVASQPASGGLDQNAIDSLAQSSVQNLPQKQFNGITKETDLNLVVYSDASLKNYVSTYYSQTQNLRKIMGQDIPILNDYMTNHNGSDKDKISAITLKYQNIINTLIKTPLPTEAKSILATWELKIINDLEKIIKIDNDIINTDKDVAHILSDIIVYNNTLDDLVTNIETGDLIFKINR